MGPSTLAAPPSPIPTAPLPDELISEAELGLVWLKRRAELVRLELQAIELELALQQARLGEQETLQIWLGKHGTPWTNHSTKGESSYLAIQSNMGATAALSHEHPRQPEPSQLAVIPETSRPAEQILRSDFPATKPAAYKAIPPSPTIDSNPHPPTEVPAAQQNKPLAPATNDLLKQTAPTSPSTAATITPPKPITKTPERKPQSNLPSPSQTSSKQKKHAAKPLPAEGPKQPLSARVVLRTETKLSANATPQAETLTAIATAKKMPPWLISTAAHAALLVLLMIFTLPLPEKRETLGLSGTFKPETTTQLQITETTQNVTSEMENQTLEDVKLASPPMENVLSSSLPSASDIAASINASPDLGSLATPSDMIGQSGSGMNGQLGDSLSSSQMMAAANFFGLEATGNVFCFVVDCSGSMRGEPFVTAKRELLRSISQLKPNQRFFVVFFSQKLFPMQLDGPEMPDSHPTAVYATPENLSKLQQWMETVPIGAGGPPNEALKLAIELESDSVFLLTDGVTRSDVASYLQRTNRQEDELDGPQIRCPIHTIGFYSREGEALLQRIASENRGQYHYVPDPQPNKKK
jgi:hypothetical protein